jgi:hypothetical protein
MEKMLYEDQRFNLGPAIHTLTVRAFFRGNEWKIPLPETDHISLEI